MAEEVTEYVTLRMKVLPLASGWSEGDNVVCVEDGRGNVCYLSRALIVPEVQHLPRSGLTITLSDWEQVQLSHYASHQAMTYVGHYRQAGLQRPEISTMNHWCDLAAKLANQPNLVGHLDYRGTAANGFDPEGED